jgi:tripartite-type tricarboxylate transporter receptor subunit TctC
MGEDKMARIGGWKILASVAAILWICAAAAPLRAQDSEAAFYKGKTVRIIVGYGPGGGYDTYARMIAPYIAKALGTTVVVENQPGAGGITALDNLVVAPPDGLQMMIVNGTGAVQGQLISLPGVRYDLGKVGHLGTVSASPWVWLVAPNSPIKTPQDAIDAHKQMMWSASGPIDGLSDGAAFTCEALALNCRVVMGYPGSNEAALAVSKGEMDAIYVSDTSANDYVRAGQERAVATMGRKKSRFFPDTPTIFEALKLTPDQEWLFDFRATVEALGRILVVPPNLPPARLAYLQAAVKKALSDPQLIAEGERTERYVDYLDAEQTRAATLKVVDSITPEQRQRVKAVLTKTE